MAPVDAPKNVELIKEIEKHPCLYNYMHPDYSKKHVTEITWQRVADKMNEEVVTCKERWKNLRIAFTTKMKASSQGASKPYYLTENMQFLVPYLKRKKNINNTSFLTTLDAHGSHSAASSSSHSAACDRKDVIKLEPEDEESDIEFWDSSLMPLGSPPVEWVLSPNPTTTTASDIAGASTTQDAITTAAATATATTSSSFTISQRMKRGRNSVHRLHSLRGFGKRVKASGSYGSIEGGDRRKMFLQSLLRDVYSMTDVQMRKFRRLVLEAIDTAFEEVPNGVPGQT